MIPTTSALLIALSLALVLLGAQAQDVKGDGGPKDPDGPQDRTSSGGCRGCSPTSTHNCNTFVWYQGRTTNTGYSCSNCRSHKGMADHKCYGFEQSAEDDLDTWVLNNCGVRVNCESTRVQSSNISGRRKKKNRWILCDKCKWVDLKYTCTYDYLCTVLHP